MRMDKPRHNGFSTTINHLTRLIAVQQFIRRTHVNDFIAPDGYPTILNQTPVIVHDDYGSAGEQEIYFFSGHSLKTPGPFRLSL
jgi:hypothetical protein